MHFSDPPSGDRWQHPPHRWLAQLIGAVTFYTCIPIPVRWPVIFEGIARFAPLVGLGIGLAIAGLDWALVALGLPLATRCALVVVAWLGITGGLHLDGAMDTADGLAVPNPDRRLAVMADSRTGAFGVMAAVGVLGLKGVGLADLETLRWASVPLVAAWGRWGQVVAIARYPYLRVEGKGAFHKAHAQPSTDWLWGCGVIVGFMGIAIALSPDHWPWLVAISVSGCAIALATGAWFNRALGGHTGDTYGAIVEWTEALLLCLMVGLQGVL